MEKIKIGQIVNAVALRGEVKVYSYSDYKERFEELDDIYIGDEIRRIEKVRYQNEMVILKLEGTSDRNAAEALKGKEIFITEADLRPLPEDTYYIRDMIGLRVIDETGNEIGTLSDVIQNTAQDLYEIKKKDGKTFLVPAVSEFVIEINMMERLIRVRHIEGLLEL